MGRPIIVEGHVSVSPGADYMRRRRAANREGIRARDRETLRAYMKTPQGKAKHFFKSISKRAKEDGLPFDLDHAWFKERLERGVCEFCGLPFTIGDPKSNRVFWASVDRIVPALGYVKSNCRMVLFGVNGLKTTGSDEDVLRIATAIVDRHGPSR